MPRDPDAGEERAVNDPATVSGTSSPDPDPDPDPDGSDSEQRQQPEAATRTETAASVTALSVPIPKPYVSPPFGEITMAATCGGQPVEDIDPSDLEIRVGGEPSNVVFIDGPEEAIVRIGIVIDLHDVSSPDIAWLSGMARGLVESAIVRPWMVFVGDANGDFSRFGISSSQVAEAVRPAGDDSVVDLPTLIESALDRRFQFPHRSERAFLVVVTDGGGPRASKKWAETHRTVASVGIPVLVAGIWNREFPSSLRKDLRKSAAVSGGSVFYVEGAAQADDLIARYGTLIEGSYAVGIDRPPGSKKVEVRLNDPDLEIVASTALRESDWRQIPDNTERIRGMFTYWADAAIFEGCWTRHKIPVAMKADYLAAERAYLDARSGPGEPLLVTMDARAELRSTMEGEGLEFALVIDRFIAVHPGEDCE